MINNMLYPGSYKGLIKTWKGSVGLITLALAALLVFPAVASEARMVLSGAQKLRSVGSGNIKIDGYVGNRLNKNLNGILMHKDEERLLRDFRNRVVDGPAWIGEHVGKWMSASSMMYTYSDDKEMLAKLKRVATGLMDTQLENGYMGTYAEPEWWTRWDVWVHKYNLLGLLAYYDATGDKRALDACRKMGDLIISNFGPGKKDIIEAGLHQGMAATSILEPFVDLFIRTGDPRYRDFADYIVSSLEQKNGSHVVSSLLKKRPVYKVANAKAYEMISNILGLLALYRVEGKEEWLTAAKMAFDDITTNRAYITGGASYAEAFYEDGYFPNSGHVAETCVVMSQAQLARELQLLTGDAKYGNAAEHLIFNHLLACQHPSGESICYYTPLWNRKFYMATMSCCISSGPRSIALIPSLYCLQSGNRVVLNLLSSGEVKTKLVNGETAHIFLKSKFPFSDRVSVQAKAIKGKGYTLAVRIPPSSFEPKMKINGKQFTGTITPGEYVEVKVPAGGAKIELDLGFRWKVIPGKGANEGLFALQYGPVIFAYDHAFNTDVHGSISATYDADPEKLAPKLTETGGKWVARVNGYVRQNGEWSSHRIALVPYMDAGENDHFSVWLRDRAKCDERSISLFTQVHELVSREGKTRGSMVDNSTETFTATNDGKQRAEDYFEVDAGWPCEFNIIIFRHGKSLPDGGWFDTSKGKPKITYRSYGTEEDYEQIAVIEDYPETTAESQGTLRDGQEFRVVLKKPVTGYRIRVVGTPAHGNEPGRNFASCSEIQVFYNPEFSEPGVK